MIAGIVGILFIFILGPVGIIIGIGLTVFIIEFWRKEKAKQSIKAAIYATVGVFSSTIIQFLVSSSLLLAFLLALLF